MQARRPPTQLRGPRCCSLHPWGDLRFDIELRGKGLGAQDAAVDWVHCLTGTDPAKTYRGQVKTEEEAKALLAKKGGVLGLIKRTAKSRGWQQIERHYAQRGDLILFESSQGPALGVCAGPVFAAAAAEGLTYYEMTHALRAWRIN